MTQQQSKGPLRWVVGTIAGGAVMIMPFLIIFGIIHYLFTILTSYLVKPFAIYIMPERYEETNLFYAAPLISVAIVLCFLFVMGLMFRTRIRLLIEWSMRKVPGIATLYDAVNDTAMALKGPPGIANVDTVVLVPFPQPEMRMAGYLMTRHRQPDGRILCSVYIPIVLFPPSGYTVLVPEEQVVITDWPTKDVWKLLLSGGLTLPPEVPFNPEDGDTTHNVTSGTAANDQT